MRQVLTSATEAAFTFIAPVGFNHPKTRAHGRLLGPCFKTGRMKPYDRQHPKHIVRRHRPSDRQQLRCTASSPPRSTTNRRDGTPAPRGMCCDSSIRTRAARTPAYNRTSPRGRTYLADACETRFRSMLTRTREKCDGGGREPHGHSRFGSANRTATPPTGWISQGALLAPFVSFQRFHVLFNSLSKVLFIFPSRYLFAIGLVPIFSP